MAATTACSLGPAIGTAGCIQACMCPQLGSVQGRDANQWQCMTLSAVLSRPGYLKALQEQHSASCSDLAAQTRQTTPCTLKLQAWGPGPGHMIRHGSWAHKNHSVSRGVLARAIGHASQAAAPAVTELYRMHAAACDMSPACSTPFVLQNI